MKLDDILKENYETIEAKEIVLPQKNKITTPGVEMILQAYKKVEELSKTETLYKYPTAYMQYTHLYKPIIRQMNIQKISPEDITQFSLFLQEFEDKPFFHTTGLFLSALINTHQNETKNKETYSLLTGNLNQEFRFLGLENRSHLHIVGNVGGSTCALMSGGTVSIEGDAKEFLGVLMNAGIIEIHGKPGNILGCRMKGGTVKVYGDADTISPEMLGGTIEIFGSYKETSPEYKYGTIIHQGKTIFHKEKPWYKKMIGWIR